ncbi:gamma-glutamyltransferase [Salibacterium salarium]|uniref:Glutathione hydrolase proenzyme n=1 Tax=Salibacterium salarium TaxID=284579 RepID=A0A428N266_9BACI|nr:gamma-glutamyltransferase [Salibacterium salarium]RSL32436.1 gamma-glutamyltransferase [Salibacterium salarium]
MKEHLSTYPYASKRTATFGKKGMVATSQPLASQAGLDMLKKGGNAVDAAIATAACLTVVEPSSNGIGGDAFALVWINNSLYGLNASGPAPNALSAEEVKRQGYNDIPTRGFTPVTVPGAPSAWVSLSERFGCLPFEELLEPAITYAREGYPLSPVLARNWNKTMQELKNTLSGEQYNAFFETFAPKGKIPSTGEMWKSEAFAQTLEKIASSKGDAFYQGEIAEKIDAFSQQYGGYIRKEDLARYAPEWVTPVQTSYKGYNIWETPPNGQGLVALMALNLLNKNTFHEKEQLDTYHQQIEAMKLAFADGEKYITDPRKMTVKAEELLSESYAEKRRACIGSEAREPDAGEPQHSGTVYLATADDQGNMVSFIQSNYYNFGSGLLVPGTGVLLQNRGNNFSLDSNHVNFLKPNKKTYHTIIPGFITKGDQPIGPLGVMGFFMQPQGHVQVAMNMIDFHLNPQAALDAPRWQWMGNQTIRIEQSVSPHIIEGLAQKGHRVEISIDSNEMGRGQVIWRDPDSNVLYGGTEPRTDGSVAAW